MADFIAGKALELLYGGIEKLIVDNVRFKSVATGIKEQLDALRPIVRDLDKLNLSNQPNRPEDSELTDLKVLLDNGATLVANCFAGIRLWNVYKKYKYTKKLVALKDSLQQQLDLLKLRQVVDVKENKGMLHVIGGDVKKAGGQIDEIQEKVEYLWVENQRKSATSTKAGCELPPLPQLIVGMDVPLKKLKDKFFKDEESILVLTAPGGCGKTTLATMFCQDHDVKGKFKKNIFFVTVSQKPNLELIMKELYKQKGYEAPSFQNGVFPIKWLQQIENEGDNPLLLVLDDVWCGSESLLEKFEYAKMPKYKILVTSRCDFPRFGPSYHLQLLDTDHAMELFHHTSSLGDKSSHIPESLAKEVVRHCNGFPLAIKVVGRSLCGQPIETWRRRVTQWSKRDSILDCEMELFQCLQSSFDALANATLKACLLDICAFPEDARIKVTAIIDMWVELYDELDEPTSCIDILYELNYRNLVIFNHPKSDGEDNRRIPEAADYSGYKVRQHDLLRELAIYNTKQGPVQDRERLIIEISQNKFPKWWREQTYPHMSARFVSITTDSQFSGEWPSTEFPEAEILVLIFQSETYVLPEFLKRMNKLKMLYIQNSSGDYVKVDSFELLSSLPKLRNLRFEMIDLSCIMNIPVQLKKVHKLYLEDCRDDSGNLKLSILFPEVKQVVFDWFEMSCTSSAAFIEDLGELNHVTKLKVINCDWFTNKELVTITCMISLEELMIECECGDYISYIPDSIRNVKKLKLLKISNSRLTELPAEIGELQCLRYLIIDGADRLLKLPDSVGDLVNLEVLRLRDCFVLKSLPDSIRFLQKLNFLDIHFCPDLVELPEHIGEMKCLRKLHMDRCFDLKELPESVSDLELLEEVICHRRHDTLWEPLLPKFKYLSISVGPEEEEEEEGSEGSEESEEVEESEEEEEVEEE